MGHECSPVLSNTEGPSAWRALGKAAVKRGGSTQILCLHSRAGSCAQTVSAAKAEPHLRGICQSLRDAAPSPLPGRLRVGADAQKVQGKDKILRQQGLCSLSATTKCVGKEWQEPPHFQYCHNRISVPVKSLKNVSTTTQHCHPT